MSLSVRSFGMPSSPKHTHARTHTHTHAHAHAHAHHTSHITHTRAHTHNTHTHTHTHTHTLAHHSHAHITHITHMHKHIVHANTNKHITLHEVAALGIFIGGVPLISKIPKPLSGPELSVLHCTQFQTEALKPNFWLSFHVTQLSVVTYVFGVLREHARLPWKVFFNSAQL